MPTLIHVCKSGMGAVEDFIPEFCQRMPFEQRLNCEDEKVLLVFGRFNPGQHQLIFDSENNYCGFCDRITGELIEGHDPATGETVGLPTAFYVNHRERDGIVGVLRLFGFGGPGIEIPYDAEVAGRLEIEEILRDTLPPMIGIGQDGAALGRPSTTKG